MMATLSFSNQEYGFHSIIEIVKWNKKEINQELVRMLVKDFAISPFMATVLARRGMLVKTELPFFLENDISYLHQPFLFKDMELAVNRVLKAKEEGEKALIFGDKDVDGITGTAIIVKALQELEIDTEWQVPLGDQGYGITQKDIHHYYGKHCSLIITIDCGISSHKEVAYANSLGIDTLIFDHHTPGMELPPAYAIIDAKISQQGYPFPYICAATLAYKLYTALAFSQGDYYQQDICLFNAVPLKEAVNIELLCVRNLVPKWTRTITISQELKQNKEELAALLSELPVLVYDAEQQKTLLKTYLGDRVDIYFLDIADNCAEILPEIAGQSLLEIREQTRFSKYYEKKASEIEILYRLYVTMMTKKYSFLTDTSDKVIDLAAIATIADIMPLQGENRIIVKKGIEKLSTKPNFGLNSLMAELKLNDKKLLTQTIGWKLAPVINASGRMGSSETAVRLLLEEDAQQAQKLAKQLVEFNKQRIAQMNSLMKDIKPSAQEKLQKYENFIILLHEAIPQTFTGAVANYLLRQFTVPAIIITRAPENTMNASIRCDAFLNATKLIEDIRYLLIDGGGHRAAAGFSFKEENYEQVLQELERGMHTYLSMNTENLSMSTENNQASTLDIDLEIPEQYFNLEQLKALLADLEPFGEQWPKLNILLQNIELLNFTVIGETGQHVKMILKIASYRVPAIIWNYSSLSITLDELKKASRISFISHIKIDSFNSTEQFTFIVKQLEMHP